MRALRATAWVMLLTASGAACRGGAAPAVAPDPNTPVPVEVENHFQGDVVVYLLRGSQKHRLGLVTALSRGDFMLHWRNLGTTGSARLMAHPLAGVAYESETLHLQPGQSIKWTLESDLDRSTLVVY